MSDAVEEGGGAGGEGLLHVAAVPSQVAPPCSNLICNSPRIPDSMYAQGPTRSHPTLLETKLILDECVAIRSRARLLNDRVRGPMDADGDVNTLFPLVLLLGNHSSGKSSFINHILKTKVQDCGVAPTDDKFTVLVSGGEDIDKDGNALIGNEL